MIEDTIYIGFLYDCYGSLFTDKQREYFEDYYFQNLTCQEISENKGVSRNAVHKQIKEVVTKLEWYERNLRLYEKNKKIENIICILENKEIKEEIKRIIWE